MSLSRILNNDPLPSTLNIYSETSLDVVSPYPNPQQLPFHSLEHNRNVLPLLPGSSIICFSALA